MTGGLAYILRAEAEEVLGSREFVALADTEAEEQLWLRRRVLEAHQHFTASRTSGAIVRAKRCATAGSRAAVHFRGTIADTWKPVLERLLPREPLLVATGIPETSQARHCTLERELLPRATQRFAIIHVERLLHGLSTNSLHLSTLQS